MRRVLALLGALLLIGLAVVVRGRLDARDAGPDRGQLTGTVVCVPEAKAACDTVAARNPGVTVRVEPVGTTLDALSRPDARPDTAKVDAWVAPQPFTAMVEESRSRGGQGPVLGTASGTLARSPVTLVVWGERAAALKGACPGGDLTWSCIGDVAGQPWSQHGGQPTWGAVKPGHPPAGSDATGLLVLAQASGQRIGRSDFARNDLDDPAFQGWFDQLERAVPTWTPSAGTAVREMATTGPATFDLAGGLEAQAGPAATTSRYKDQLSILYPSPVATADLVAVPLAGDEAGSRLVEVLADDDVRVALAQAGWRVDGQPAAVGVRPDVTLPAGNGLPKPGVLEALRTMWKDVIQ